MLTNTTGEGQNWKPMVGQFSMPFDTIGIESLLADWDDTQSLTPEENERIGRRTDAA